MFLLQEGTICFWSPELELKRNKQVVVLISIGTTNYHHQLDQVSQPDTGTRDKPKWISDMVLSLPHSKIILTTGYVTMCIDVTT